MGRVPESDSDEIQLRDDVMVHKRNSDPADEYERQLNKMDREYDRQMKEMEKEMDVDEEPKSKRSKGAQKEDSLEDDLKKAQALYDMAKEGAQVAGQKLREIQAGAKEVFRKLKPKPKTEWYQREMIHAPDLEAKAEKKDKDYVVIEG